MKKGWIYNMQRVLLRYLVFVKALLIIFYWQLNIYAAQPPERWDSNPDIIVEGRPLTVTWDKEEHRPKVIVWVQDFTIPSPYYVTSEQKTITIPRTVRNELPAKILVVPENNLLKPKIIEVKPTETEVIFKTDLIPPNEIWFWGLTPPNPCLPGWAMNISARLIHNTKVYADFCGAFLWHITLSKEDNYEIAFYLTFYPKDALADITIKDFGEANDISKAFCHIHHGGECKFTFETNKNVWGKSHQIIFKLNPFFDKSKCPI
ncbi:MAG: hypothetical protein JW714_04690 [Candidatus Omnitrophica bacterium]|nr:hypothetical protein [Candidatus Omnitrophota bacterium]